MKSLFREKTVKRAFRLESFRAHTVRCAYFSKNKLRSPEEKAALSATLARVVRAWSESSIRAGLSPKNRGMTDEIYRRLREKFHAAPQPLPYQYCLLELIRN